MPPPRDSETGNSGESAFIPIDPVRAWDSRVDNPDGGEKGPLYDAVPLQLDFSEFLYEVEGLDQDYLVDAVVLNVTVPGGSANMSGYVSVTPSLCDLVGVDEPTYSCLENIYAERSSSRSGRTDPYFLCELGIRRSVYSKHGHSRPRRMGH